MRKKDNNLFKKALNFITETKTSTSKKSPKKPVKETKPKAVQKKEQKTIGIIDKPKEISKSAISEIMNVCKTIKESNGDHTKETGRPSPYDPNIHLETALIAFSQGKDLTAVAADLGISWATLHRWIEAHEEFRYAINEGKKLSERWWTEMGRLNLNNKYFNNTLYMMNMQNRFGWTRKLDASIKKEEHIVNEERKTVNINVHKDEELAEVLEILLENGAIQVEEKVNYITHKKKEVEMEKH